MLAAYTEDATMEVRVNCRAEAEKLVEPARYGLRVRWPYEASLLTPHTDLAPMNRYPPVGFTELSGEGLVGN